MKIKILCIGILALSMMTSAALSKRGDGTSALDDSAMMSPFYSDASMKTMKPDADFTNAWQSMKTEDQADIITDCGDAELNARHQEFCAKAFQLGGHQ
jgi:hypothetical protein